MNAVVIVAGGTGERTGIPGGKQLASLHGRAILSLAIEAFERCPAIDEIVVVVHPDRVEEYRRTAIEPAAPRKVTAVVGGGDTRQASVAAGLAAVSADATVIAVHDGARPLVTPDLIAGALDALVAAPTADGVVVGHPSYDTLKVVDAEGRIVSTPDRATLWAVQTPQVFRANALREAYRRAELEGFTGTDDASLVERLGGTVLVYQGPRDNIKITVAGDVLVAERLLEARGAE